MYVAGVDEVGRGPLAGDVVACAVIMPDTDLLNQLKDSKALTEKRRELLFEQIKQSALAWAVGRCSPQEIDKLNILQASLLAMRRAVDSLKIRPDKVLVDGNKLPDWQYQAEAIVQGDKILPLISAASILAKVIRDREMHALDKIYPRYGFAKHKGYPTKQHLQAIAEFGICKIHRVSFAPVKKVLLENA